MKYLAILIALLLNPGMGKCQNNSDAINLISSFVDDVYFSNIGYNELANRYMFFEKVDNPKYTMEDRLDIFKKHITKIRKQKIIELDKSNLKTIAYDDFTGEKASFGDENSSNIFILTNEDKPIRYFYIKGNKIFSFEHITKTPTSSYFITY